MQKGNWTLLLFSMVLASFSFCNAVLFGPPEGGPPAKDISWKANCTKQILPADKKTLELKRCVKCICLINGIIKCMEWYDTDENKTQVHKSCINCDPDNFARSLDCKCYDNAAKLFRQPRESWKASPCTNCICSSQSRVCDMERLGFGNFYSQFSTYMLQKSLNESLTNRFPSNAPVSHVVNASLCNQVCNIAGITIKHGQVQHIGLSGYPRCAKCGCFHGKPYCEGIWSAIRKFCTSQSTCKDFVEFAMLACKYPDNIECEKETYSWSLNGCNYTCAGGKLKFHVIKRPWCQRLADSKYCASCGNKTEFLAKYGSQLLLCPKKDIVISKEEICDGFSDCEDGSDEENCSKIFCGSTATNVANQTIIWPRMEVNASIKLECNLVNGWWKGSFVKTCLWKKGQKAKFSHGTYCSCKDARIFQTNVDNHGNVFLQLFSISKSLLQNVTTSVRASQYFHLVENLSAAAQRINFTDSHFWKIINDILMHDAPCQEDDIDKKKNNFMQLLKNYHGYNFSESSFENGGGGSLDSNALGPLVGAYIASSKRLLISELKILQMTLQGPGVVIKPQSVDIPTMTPGTYIISNGTSFHPAPEKNETKVITDDESKRVQAEKRRKEILEELRHMKIARIIGTVLSSFTVLVCIICLILYKVLRVEESTKVFLHKNLFVTWILCYGLQAAYGFFSSKFQKNKDFCTAYLIVVHYMFLSFFCWMSLEGLNIVLVLVLVFQARKKRHYLYALVGWGLPLCIVVVEVAAFFDSFSKTENCIWLDRDEWLLKGPMGFLLSINCLFFIAIIAVLLKSISKSPNSSAKTSKSRATAKAFLVLLPLLGVTYFLGFAAMNRVVMYIYAVVHSLMGLLLCVFHFFLDKTVQTAFKEYKRKRAVTKGSSISDINSVKLAKIGMNSSCPSYKSNNAI